MTWADEGISARLTHATEVFSDVKEDLVEGGNVIIRRSDELVPKESGALGATGRVDESRGGKNTVAMLYSGPYARYIHEHLFFKHPHGGQAKFLETAMLEEGHDAIVEAGQSTWARI